MSEGSASLGYGILMAGEMLADMDWPMHVQSRGTVRTQVHARAASSPSSLFRLLPFLKSGNNSFGDGREAIDLTYQTMLAELTQRTMDRAWTADFPAEGRFITAQVKDKRYWYIDIPDGSGGKSRRYAGPADDPEIAQRVESFKRNKDDFRARRRMVTSLTREGGMIAPDALSGDIVEALAAGGFFRLRGVLIGTVAFQTCAGILGVRLPMAVLLTGDADLAHPASVRRAAAGCRSDISACSPSIGIFGLQHVSN